MLDCVAFCRRVGVLRTKVSNTNVRTSSKCLLISTTKFLKVVLQTVGGDDLRTLRSHTDEVAPGEGVLEDALGAGHVGWQPHLHPQQSRPPCGVVRGPGMRIVGTDHFKMISVKTCPGWRTVYVIIWTEGKSKISLRKIFLNSVQSNQRSYLRQRIF